MYIHAEKELTFLAMERTGSRSVAELLKKVGFELVGDHHHGPEEGLEVVGQAFTVVRNHWDLVASLWWSTDGPLQADYITQDWCVEKFLSNPGVFRAGRLFRFLDLPEVTVLRYETLAADVQVFLENQGWLDPDEIALPRVGTSTERAGTPFVETYTPHAARYVAWCWHKEIKELGYRFNRAGRVSG